MRDLIVKLETLKESKEREKIVQGLKDGQAEKNNAILEGKEKDEVRLYSEAEMIRHEISFIDGLIGNLKIKDKETREVLIEDLEKSKNWRIDRLLGRTHEYKLDNILDWDSYMDDDLVRAENRWIECFDNLPTKVVNELKMKEAQVEEMKEAEVDEQINALSSLELNGL